MSNAKPYRILIVDDHPLVRRGLRALLEKQPGLEVTCEAANGAEALEYVRTSKPDLAILDLTMPNMNGLVATRSIRQESPSTEVLILTMHFTDDLAREVLRTGALGYILKSDADTELLAAVDHMRHHLPFFTSRLSMSLARDFIAQSSVSPGNEKSANGNGDANNSPLTDREIEVVRLLAQGKSNKEAAGMLGVSSRTVESHRNHIMRKMSFASFSDLVRYAVRNNLVDP